MMPPLRRLLIAAALALLRIMAGSAFNLDLRTVVIHSRPDDTGMFGFAVAQHRDKGSSWLLVGAPLAQTRQPNVDRGGAVYRCSPDISTDCQEIAFDRKGPRTELNNSAAVPIDDKSGQWFGATLHSSGPNGVVVACAPRYVYFSTNFRRREPVGTCFVARNSFTDFQEYSPCRTSAWGYHRQGFCQAGFSAVLTPDSRRLFMGAVGSWYWQGQLFSQDLFSRADLLSTSEGPAYDDDSYLGYSSAVGEFSGDDETDIVVGMPRGSNLTGKVVLFNSTLNNLYNLTGEQMGSYFGYAVCVVDVNNDGLHDIIIGAPFYSDLSAKDGSYETGKVYVVYQSRKHQFRKWHVLNGKMSKSRFGLALTSMGDVNRDGFGDFVVGAPYGGKNEKGAIYLFHGSKDGVRTEHSQVIYGEDVDSTVSSFGFSLSGGLDLDNNEYPDLLVGAYNASKALFFKSRPVVTVTASLQITPDKINLDEKVCSLLDGTVVSCVIVNTCLEYTGIGVPSKLEFEFLTQLDVLKDKAPRVYFLTSEQDHIQNLTAILQKDSIYCKSIYVYIKSSVQDKLTPIIVEVNYTLVDRRPRKRELKPVLNQYIPTYLKKPINIQKNCGKDNICIPELQLNAMPIAPSYLMGSQERLELEINITNAGEDAFETVFYMEIPAGVSYINIEKMAQDLSVFCTEIKSDLLKLKCDIGNPLPANHTVRFKILLSPTYLNATENEYEFLTEVNSTNPENDSTQYNNILLIHVPVQVKVELAVAGISRPDIVLYNKTAQLPEVKKHESDIGPEVIHLYDVWNRGPSTILEAEVYILWPTYTIAGHHLLYLVEQPEVSGLGNCEFIPNVNPENVTIEKNSALLSHSVLNVMDVEEADDKENGTIRYKAKSRARRASDEDFQRELSCGPTLCSQIYCTIHSLNKDDHVYFTVRSRLWLKTLKTLGFEDVEISSKIVTRVTLLPYSVQPHYLDHKVLVVGTIVSPADTEFVRKHVPWWIVIVAVCAGILLLGILIILLWKLGFFKRKLPHSEMEREPLNKPERNGKLSNGDELL